MPSRGDNGLFLALISTPQKILRGGSAILRIPRMPEELYPKYPSIPRIQGQYRLRR